MPDDASPATERPLIDILYRDGARVASLVAQILGGRRLTVEETSSDRAAKERELGISSWFKGKNTSEVGQGVKETFDVTDLAAIDLIGLLEQRGLMTDGGTKAANGRLIRVTGEASFRDGYVMEVAARAIPVSKDWPKAQRDFLSAISSSLKVPSFVLLVTENHGRWLAILKPDGMVDVIQAYTARFADDALPGVTMIGIKETPTAGQGVSPLFDAMQLFLRASREFISPTESHPITPVLIYRVLRS